MQEYWNFILQNCIIILDAEQVYLKLQATNVKNTEVKANPKPKTLEKNGPPKTLNPEPWTLNPKHQIHQKP